MKNKNHTKKPEQKKTKIPLKPAATLQLAYPAWLKYAILAAILSLTFWCYHYSLHNEFVNWDDGLYLYENPFIKHLTCQNLKVILFKNITHNYYHPLTMLSLAINWHFSGPDTLPYYATEITLHLLNTMLVFFLSFALFNAMAKNGYGKIKGIPYLAGLCALWFGIHPMHVESVSWLAERKDVLYLFFYLSGLIVYIKYITKKSKLLLALVAFLFFLSLLSKPLAVVFPLSLFTIDILLKRKTEWNLVVEKIPFFIISLVFGYISYVWTNTGGSIASSQTLTIMQRIAFAGYNYLMYLVKLFVPAHLCSYYPYPELNESKNLPFYFYMAPLAAICITIGLLYIAYKKGENCFRVTLFGFGFYFLNIMLALQLISVGPAIMADRYSYASYIGFTFMLVYFIYNILQKGELLRKIAIVLIFVYMFFLTILCYQRTFVWHNAETLWTDVIKQYPNRIIVAYSNLGNYYLAHVELDKAYDNFAEAINFKPPDAQAYCNMGTLMGAKKQFAPALDNFATSLKIDSTNGLTYLNRALTYSAMGKYDLAMADYRHSVRLQPYSEFILHYIAFTFLNAQQYDSAISYYNRAIEINPGNSQYFHYRGMAEFNTGKTQAAINDFMQNLHITPHDSECMFYLSLAYTRINDLNSAYKYVEMAQNAQYPVPQDYIGLLEGHLKKKN